MARKFVIKKEFRSKLSEKLMDLGNYAIVGLVLGQLLSNEVFDANLFLLGVVFAMICYIASYFVELD